MSNIFCILHQLLIIYSLIFQIRSQQPLIFSSDTLEIYPDWKTATDNSGPYAIACPPYSSAEKEFNIEGSLDHKALFVRGYSENIYFLMPHYNCVEYNINLAAVVRKDATFKEKFVEFGYEVYIDQNEVDGRFKVFDFKKFSRLLPPTPLIKKPAHFIQNLVTDNSPYVKKKKIYYDDYESSHEYFKLDFLWFPRASMKYDFSKWNVQKLTYFITQDARDLLESCHNDYTLGMEFYGEDDVNSYYLEANQKTVFDEVTLPENLLIHGGKCLTHTVCVAPYSLLSPYQFRSSPLKAFPCSSLDKIPVWYETAEKPLNYLEKFLVPAAEVTNQRLKIIVGTYKTLTFPTKKDNNPQEIKHHRLIIIRIIKFCKE